MGNSISSLFTREEIFHCDAECCQQSEAILAAATQWRRLRVASVFLLGLIFLGCSVPNAEVTLPGTSVLERDQLIIHSDFYIPKKHRLIDELSARRLDISEQLKLPSSDEPINVFVFETEDEFREYLQREHPEFPNRRAFFVKSDTTLKVFAYWGERIGEDLRHEVAHGYFHSVVSNLPLWLDEGLAEYFETPRGTHGLNSNHVFLLNNAFRRGDWSPDLNVLENLESPAEMNQLHYAESWLWVHFLLESENADSKILQDQLARLRMSAESEPLSNFLFKEIDDADVRLVEHLKQLADGL